MRLFLFCLNSFVINFFVIKIKNMEMLIWTIDYNVVYYTLYFLHFIHNKMFFQVSFFCIFNT